ncbi:hypothetical protein QJS04_geneDACA017137 [Acorus gramineus]|uniref:Uncharacterized protein n=1 Tax=Acorus gramineus TaxID=55184 RepID=A0AAV9BQT5_ACOGR|nr:hypothetical protein QJS04_geneDACA017137 [Acorus gramineus]
MCTRGHWRPVEDEKLKELVKRYGPHNWNTIAENLPGRSDGNDSIEFYDFLCVNTEDSEKQSKNCMGGDDTTEEGDVDNERRHNEAAVPFIDFLAMESSS